MFKGQLSSLVLEADIFHVWTLAINQLEAYGRL